MSVPEVRPAQPADRDAALALLLAQLREHDIATPPAAVAAALDGLMTRPERGSVLVATLDGRVVGIAALSATWTIEHGGRAMWLEELYVEPSHRGHGVGGVLLSAAADAARAHGAHTLDLEVEASHTRAANLYAREGFRRLERTRWVRRL